MAEKNNKKMPLEIPQTRGSFQIRGLVSGVESDRFYTERTTNSDKLQRILNFGVKFDKDVRHFVELSAFEQRSVYFTKTTGEGKDRKTDTIEVPWRDRKTYSVPEGYRLIGTRIGLERTVDDKGKTRNKNVDMTPFDACEYASGLLKDDAPVFVRGNITYSVYNDQHRKHFEIAQISNSQVDFDSSDFVPHARFTQRIVYMGIAPSEDKKRYILSGKVVGYNSVEDIELIVEDRDMANSFRKYLKPYYAVDVSGDIRIVKNDEDVTTPSENEPYWGKPNPMKQRNLPTVIEFVVDGVDGESIDGETYSEENIDRAIRLAKNIRTTKADFGDADDDKPNWGKGVDLSGADDDEDEDW